MNTEQTRVYKAVAEDVSDDPYTFVASTPVVDRVGDIVEQDWDLRPYKKNPIILWGHDNKSPIGKAKKIWIDKTTNYLMIKMELAEKGTSRWIDTLRSLIEQKILRAVSVGFYPHKATPIDEDEPWGGYVLSDNELLEVSLVSIPANPQALSLAKSLSDSQRQRLFPGKKFLPETYPAVKQLGGPKSVEHINTGKPSITIVQGNTSVTLHDTKRISLDELQR